MRIVQKVKIQLCFLLLETAFLFFRMFFSFEVFRLIFVIKNRQNVEHKTKTLFIHEQNRAIISSKEEPMGG